MSPRKIACKGQSKDADYRLMTKGKPPMTTLAVKIPSDLHRSLKLLSVTEGIPLRHVAAEALSAYLAEHEFPHAPPIRPKMRGSVTR